MKQHTQITTITTTKTTTTITIILPVFVDSTPIYIADGDIMTPISPIFIGMTTTHPHGD